MYRKCKNIYNSENCSNHIELNTSFIIDGFEKYLAEAQETYAQYRNEIERMKALFSCKNESELFVGLCINSSQSDEAKEKFKLSSQMIQDLFALYRVAFFKEFSLDHANYGILAKEAYTKASAWYAACYSSVYNKKHKIISFPWIVEDILQSFRNIQNSDSFSKSIVENYCKLSLSNQALSVYLENIQIKKEISQIIGHDLMIVGSHGLFLFEDTSRIDLHLVISEHQVNSFASIQTSLCECFYNVLVDKNVIKFEMDDVTSITIFCSDQTIARFVYLREHILKNPVMLPLFYAVLHFARLENVFLFLNSEKIKLDLFLEFLLAFCVDNHYVQEETVEQSHQLGDMYFDWLRFHDDLSDSLIGQNGLKLDNKSSEIILKFYNEFAFSSDRIVFKTKFEPNAIELSQKCDELLKRHFFNVFNHLHKLL